jgi:hypothetical protein
MSMSIVQRRQVNQTRQKNARARQFALSRGIFGDGDIVVKKMTLPGGAVATTAGGQFTVGSLITAAQVQSSPASEWASFAARYQQFRVRSVRLNMEPVFPGSGTPTAPGAGHGALYASDFIGASAPTTGAQVLSDEGARKFSTSKAVNFLATWARNPNAKLWNPTSAALPVANSYGIAIASDPNAAVLIASTNYYSATYEWEVELRGAQ